MNLAYLLSDKFLIDFLYCGALCAYLPLTRVVLIGSTGVFSLKPKYDVLLVIYLFQVSMFHVEHFTGDRLPNIGKFFFIDAGNKDLTF